MDNELKIRLMEAMKKRGVNIPNFSKQVGIPKERVYKWFQQGTNPKAEDSLLIENWLNHGQTSLLYPDNKESQAEKDAKIAALQNEILLMKIEKLESNLNEVLSNQKVLMAMLTVAMNHAAEFYSSGNKSKADGLKSKMRTDISAATK